MSGTQTATTVSLADVIELDLIELVTKSWAAVQSRDHTVYKVFPFGANSDEVMLHGRSHNVSLDGVESTFTWAARMHFRKAEDVSVLIDKYTIIVVRLTLYRALVLPCSLDSRTPIRRRCRCLGRQRPKRH